MMRIIAGKLGGQLFDNPRGYHTHPMGDRIRGALFNTLGDITGLTILDAFAGSGALSFEAVSRGASQVIALEPDKSAQRHIENSINKLGIGDTVKLIRAKAQSWLSTTDQQFDIVLCDPPYDDINSSLLEKLATRAMTGGIIVYSLPPDSDFDLKGQYERLSTKNYGDATLYFYRSRLVSGS
jgi:16S rRNA (guanine966-N2)-methyltransferase